MERGYEFLNHTADAKFRAWGSTLEEILYLLDARSFLTALAPRPLLRSEEKR